MVFREENFVMVVSCCSSTRDRHLERNRSVPRERSQHAGANSLRECDPVGDAGLFAVPQPEQAPAAGAPGVRGVLFRFAAELAALGL